MRVYFFICLVIFSCINFSLQKPQVDRECLHHVKLLAPYENVCYHIGCTKFYLITKETCDNHKPLPCRGDDFQLGIITSPEKVFPGCCPRSSCISITSKGQTVSAYEPVRQ